MPAPFLRRHQRHATSRKCPECPRQCARAIGHRAAYRRRCAVHLRQWFAAACGLHHQARHRPWRVRRSLFRHQRCRQGSGVKADSPQFDIELRGVMHCLNLKHPNLLSLYDVRQDDQEILRWSWNSSATRSRSAGKISQRLASKRGAAWIHGIAAGVAYLHDHGIVHRDSEPGNIFIDEGIVKIGDYGLSKFISCSRRSGQTGSVGTVHYMAPEIANGRYGKEIDIYALGIILYEMLTGHVPFEGESVGEILMKHLTAEPNVSCLAEPYRTIVARCLAKDPAKRFDSVGEIIPAPPPCPAVPRPPRASSRGQLPQGWPHFHPLSLRERAGARVQARGRRSAKRRRLDRFFIWRARSASRPGGQRRSTRGRLGERRPKRCRRLVGTAEFSSVAKAGDFFDWPMDRRPCVRCSGPLNSLRFASDIDHRSGCVCDLSYA